MCWRVCYWTPAQSSACLTFSGLLVMQRLGVAICHWGGSCQNEFVAIPSEFTAAAVMTARHPPKLSKSRFMAGLQCLKRLYLDVHNRHLADPVDPSQQAVFDAGNAVGELARRGFPGGTLVEEKYYEQVRAERSTRVLLSDASVPSLYEAAFSFEGIRTRVDILARTEGGAAFDLIEVKSSTRFKEREHLPDVSIQLHVVEGAGVPIRGVYLMHIDTSYVYQGGDHDLAGLFHLEDVTDMARDYLADAAPGALADMWNVLRGADTPGIETGRHCSSPYRCPFFGHCHAGGPEHPIAELPRLSQRDEERLKGLGIPDIDGIPPDTGGLTGLQRRVIDSVASGTAYIGSDLAAGLSGIGFPASFLDFETIVPAIPLFAGTRPYQVIPFQWSMHVRDADGSLSHRQYLHGDPGDPRKGLICSLLEAVPASGSIVAYSGYEARVLRQLASEFPGYQAPLLDLIERLVDLLPIVRKTYYHPEFHGSFSIKSVAPVLVPDLRYDDLDIPDGLAASAAYQHLLTGKASEPDAASIRKSLFTYCALDTEAMVRVYESLVHESGGGVQL